MSDERTPWTPTKLAVTAMQDATIVRVTTASGAEEALFEADLLELSYAELESVAVECKQLWIKLRSGGSITLIPHTRAYLAATRAFRERDRSAPAK